MNRTRSLLLIALAAMAGLFLYDRANSTVSVHAALVTAIDGLNTDGPETYQVMVEIDETTIALNDVITRPRYKVGDTICVNRITRLTQADRHHHAPNATDC